MSAAAFRVIMSKNGRGGGGGDGVALEVTVLSAESLRLPPSYSPLPRRLRPYVTASSSCGSDSSSTAAGAGGEHAWNDTLVIPVSADFLRGGGEEGVTVAVFSEASCRLVGATALGWCRVTAADVLDGLRPLRALRRLSYSLRCPRRGSSPGHGVVHLAVRVLGVADHLAQAAPPPALSPAPPPAQQPGWCRVAMGIPVSGASAAASAVLGMPTWACGETSR